MAKEYRLSIIVTGKDSGASSMLTGIGGSLRSIGTIAGGILTSNIFMGIANQIGEMFKQAIGATAQLQNMQMALTNLQARELIRTGDFEDMNAALRAATPLAAATMDQLERIATLSPYQLENVSNTYKMAMAFGFSSKEATSFTEALLNMGAGVGASSEMLDRMSYNLAQIRMQGKVTAMDIRQLAMAGFDLTDVLKYVGKQMGVNIKDHLDFNRAIEQGKITWEDFTKYFAEYADKNFGGAAERMSRTLMGLSSTMKDVFLLTMPKILGPALEKVTGFLNDMLNQFMTFADSGVLEEMGRDLAAVFDSPFLKNGILGLTRWFEHWAQNVDWEGVSQDIAAGIDSIDWAMLGSRAAEGAGNIANGISEALREIDWGALASSVGNGFMDFMAGLTGQGSWENVKATWSSNWQQFTMLISNDIIQLQTLLGTMFGAAIFNAFQVAGASFGSSSQLLLANFDNLKNSANGKVNEMGLMLGASMGAAMNNVISTATAALGAGLTLIVSLILNSWIPQIQSVLILLKQRFIAEIIQMLSGALQRIIEFTEPLVNTLTELIGRMRSAVKPINIIVALPDFEALANAAMEGMALLNAALSGGTKVGAKGSVNMNGMGRGQAKGGRAFGGPVKEGETYMVGERGRELFVPNQSGYIVPNHKLMGSLMPSGGGSMVMVSVNLVYAPPVAITSEREAKTVLGPWVAESVRSEFEKRGL